jgi:uncharacterized protein (TIGR02001 family)
MRFGIQGVRGATALSTGILLCAMSGQACAQWSGNAALTSDYVWRGSSQTREDPALQGGFKYGHSTGFYASVWGSGVKFAPDNGARSEFDLAAGWSGKIAADWALDLYLLRYQYPSAAMRLNWNELNASATWRDNYWLALGHSDNAMAGGRRGTYLLLGARVPIDAQWRLEASVARYLLDAGYAPSYTHGAIGLVWAFQAPFEARLSWHATDGAARRLFAGMAGSRAEFALQAAF